MKFSQNISAFKIIALSLFLSLWSCVTVIDEEYSSQPPANELIEITPESLTLDYQPLDVFFFTTNNDNKFTGIKDGVEVELSVTLDTDVDIPANTYGFNAYAQQVIPVNDRFDLIQGRVTKILYPQEVVRNGSLFSIEGFNEQTSAEYLLFDKQTLTFREMEEGFYLSNTLRKPIQVIDNKMYYLINNPQEVMSKIKYLDLDNITAAPTTVYTAEYMVWFLINDQMILYTKGSASSDRFVDLSTGQEMSYAATTEPLKSHFVSIDGGFYAQNYITSSTQLVRGFQSLDVQNTAVVATPVYSFNSNDYPGISYLGDSDMVVPNPIRNNDLIIGVNTGVGSMYIYEFNGDLGTIDPVSLPINSPQQVDFNDRFFTITDYDIASNNYQLRKIDLSNLNTVATIDLGQLQNGVILNQNNRSIFSLKSENNVSTLVELKSDNSITEIALTNNQYGYFSVIN
jgi:hypothetical protein